MSGAGVVPRVAALGGKRVGALQHHDPPAGFEYCEHRSQCRGHDPAADQHDISDLLDAGVAFSDLGVWSHVTPTFVQSMVSGRGDVHDSPSTSVPSNE